MEILKPYLQRLCEIASHGDAREESYYSAVEELLKEYAKLADKKDVQVTTLPKKTEAGNPDFRIWDGKQHIVGYIEAKAPSVNLDSIQNSEQIKRYLDTFPNLVLTNFLEFRLFRDGELIDKCNISYSISQKVSNAIINEKEPEIVRILEKFFSFSLPKVYTSKSLAIELAKRTRFLRDEIIAEELKEEKDDKGDILEFYNAFKQHLIGELTKEEFADLYSQTITYGLFVARTIDEGDFNRKLAYDRIPTTLGLLKDIFRLISLGNLPVQMEWIIDDISDVLTVTDVKSIFSQSMHLGIIEPDYDFRESKDQIFHFYETFLAEYDPETRRHTGSYYTPEPVVQYIVSSINYILKRHLNKPDGFADTSVTVLDPAAGTLTFLYKAINKAIEESNEKHGKGAKRSLIREHILNNFYAFEIKMAPYAIGHLRLSYLLESEGYKLKTDERIKLYLTNALEMEELSEMNFPGMASLSQESHLAMQVKSEQPILVILGNPPYFGQSSNTGEWITKEIKAYYQVDGHPLNEKQSKWLRDDYVKFIRLAQWKIDQAGEGVLGFITNHSYLDNPTFRGMRQSLMNSFDEIYILDLHGSALKKEVCPDGSKDENVFDIMQGVAISIFIKKKGEHGNCKIHYSELWGTRESKYGWLRGHDISTTDWQELSPKSEFYLFIPRDESFLNVYEKNLKITDIFLTRNNGILTSRDFLTIKWTPDEIWNTVLDFSGLDIESVRSKYNLESDSGGWRIELAQKDLIDSGLEKEKITPILSRLCY
ncbi:MAG: N-6 DNA methylase [Candidatus Poribacteria bacterium]